MTIAINNSYHEFIFFLPFALSLWVCTIVQYSIILSVTHAILISTRTFVDILAFYLNAWLLFKLNKNRIYFVWCIYVCVHFYIFFILIICVQYAFGFLAPITVGRKSETRKQEGKWASQSWGMLGEIFIRQTG